MSRNIALPLVAAILVSIGGMAAGSVARAADAQPAVSKYATLPAYLQGSGPLTAAQRSQVARDFVTKWGGYFQQAYNQPMSRWAVKQGQIIGKADANNLRNAMSKTTLEAAMMALRGQDMSDDKAIDYMATREQKGMVGPMALGDLASDLVFVPLPPCRIFDTRSGSPLSSGGTRSFDTYPFGGNTNFTYQGGTAAGNCGMDPAAAAVMINIAAPIPTVGGFLTVYPYGTTRPLASNLDYFAGELKNNEIVAKSANGLFDITVYAHGSTNVVGDVVGYFIRPEATALDCVNVASAPIDVATGNRSFETISCAAGYTVTGGGVGTGTNLNSYVNGSYALSGTSWFSSVQNASGSTRSYTHYATCCRVPGR